MGVEKRKNPFDVLRVEVLSEAVHGDANEKVAVGLGEAGIEDGKRVEGDAVVGH